MTFPIPLVVQAPGPVWRRLGECNRCGECCKSGDPFVEEQTDPVSPCPLLGVDAAGLHLCTDRTNSYYVNACSKWPDSPSCIVDYPSCSYTFERL